MTKNQQLDFLIERLSPGIPTPTATKDKWQLFRSLVNVREPSPVESDFLCVQDELLRSEIATKGITDEDNLHPVRENLYIWQGDITTLKSDAIVNAANSAMLGCFSPCHSCIDNAIHTYAGMQLRLTCAEIMKKQGYPEPTGQAKITAAYNLPCKYILHTVGPIISGALTKNDKQLLASCYHSCLTLAEQQGLRSIAFCCISTGLFRFPNKEAARIAVKTVTDFLTDSKHIKKVIFNVFTDHDKQIYESILR